MKVGKALRERLEIVWAETTGERSAIQTNRRYIAKAFAAGPGWGVYDRKKNAFVPEKQIARLSFDDLRETLAN